MRVDASAYEALGLKPGADAAAIERAYKRLIKRYHPDRQGGDADRAAEINRAYSTLRKPTEQIAQKADPASVAEAIYARRAQMRRPAEAPRRKVRIWPLLLIAAAILAYLKWDDLSYAASDWWTGTVGRFERPADDMASSPGVPTALAILDSALATDAIDRSVERAAALVAANDSDRLIEESRDCHRALRAEPTVEGLDRCAAFDDAVLEIQNHDPIFDHGFFGASPVTARQMTGATLLSNDYVAIEARLDRVRTRVQLMLAPAAPEPPIRSSVP